MAKFLCIIPNFPFFSPLNSETATLMHCRSPLRHKMNATLRTVTPGAGETPPPPSVEQNFLPALPLVTSNGPRTSLLLQHSFELLHRLVLRSVADQLLHSRASPSRCLTIPRPVRSRPCVRQNVVVPASAHLVLQPCPHVVKYTCADSQTHKVGQHAKRSTTMPLGSWSLFCLLLLVGKPPSTPASMRVAPCISLFLFAALVSLPMRRLDRHLTLPSLHVHLRTAHRTPLRPLPGTPPSPVPP